MPQLQYIQIYMTKWRIQTGFRFVFINSPEPRHKQFKKKTNWQNTKKLETLQVAVIATLVMYKVGFRVPLVRSEAFSICRT